LRSAGFSFGSFFLSSWFILAICYVFSSFNLGICFWDALSLRERVALEFDHPSTFCGYTVSGGGLASRTGAKPEKADGGKGSGGFSLGGQGSAAADRGGGVDHSWAEGVIDVYSAKNPGRRLLVASQLCPGVLFVDGGVAFTFDRVGHGPRAGRLNNIQGAGSIVADIEPALLERRGSQP
jgi:hypothetical protein